MPSTPCNAYTYGPPYPPKQKAWCPQSLLPNTKTPRHIIRTIPRTRLVTARIEQALHILILPQLPPLIPLLLLLHDLPCQRCSRRVLDAAVCCSLVFTIRLEFCLVVFIRRWFRFRGCASHFDRCGVAVRFFIGVLLALFAAWRFLERVCETLFP